MYFLNTLYTNDSAGPAAHNAWAMSLPPGVANQGGPDAADPSYLASRPTLVILHNPSDYLAEDHAQE